MYAKTYSYNEFNCKPEICKIEVGLSQGIPIIKYFGGVSIEYTKSREKVYFIFSSLGRKLNKNKIRVNFTSTERITSPMVDLSVITAIYLASNPINLDEEIHCFGEVDMIGNVTSDRDLSKYLYLISKTTDCKEKLIFTGKGNDELKRLYPKLKIVQIHHVNNVFEYFEGKWEEDGQGEVEAFQSDNVRIEKSDEELLLLTFLAYLSRTKALILISNLKENPNTKKVFSLLSKMDPLEELQTGRINNILSERYSRAPIIYAKNKGDLELISQDWISLKKGMSLFIDLREADKKEIQRSIQKIGKSVIEQWSILMRRCECGLSKGDDELCICTSKAREDWNILIKSIANIADISHYQEAPNREYLRHPQTRRLLDSLKRLNIESLKSDYEKGEFEGFLKQLEENRDILVEML